MASNNAESTFVHFDRVFTRKRNRSSSASEDSEFVLPGFRRDQMSKHRSCMVHLLSFKHGQKATRKQARVIKDEYGTAYCFYNSIPHGIRSRKSKRADLLPFPANVSSVPVLVQSKNVGSSSALLQSKNRRPRESKRAESLKFNVSSAPLESTDRRSRKSKHADPLPVPENVSSVPVSDQAKNVNSHFSLLQSTNTSSVSVPFQATNASSDLASFQATDTIYDPVLSQITTTHSDAIPFQAREMDTSSFSKHLERLWSTFPGDKLAQFMYLDCLWFNLYQQSSLRARVMSWIKKKTIFTRTYVFVPICCWSHWNLLVLCHLGESLDSEKPCMILLDSLPMANPRRLEYDIREFVLDIYKEEGISDQRVSQIPLLVPKVPQQRNKECGYYSLYFIKKFMETAPEIILDGDMPFINENWFSREELVSFCIALEVSKAQNEPSISENILVRKSSRKNRNNRYK